MIIACSVTFDHTKICTRLSLCDAQQTSIIRRITIATIFQLLVNWQIQVSIFGSSLSRENLMKNKSESSKLITNSFPVSKRISVSGCKKIGITNCRNIFWNSVTGQLAMWLLYICNCPARLQISTNVAHARKLRDDGSQGADQVRGLEARGLRGVRQQVIHCQDEASPPHYWLHVCYHI